MADSVEQQDAVSNGAWEGDNPLHFALPLLVIQLCLVLLVTRSLAWLLKPLRQPRVIAEVIGGVLLGPSALGHFHVYSEKIFPTRSLTLLDTVATLGLMFFIFIVGLELDLNEIRRTGKKAFTLAIAGIAVPFIAGVGVASLVKETISNGVKFAPLVIFMGVPLSITAFPVLVRILAERKLLSTDVGQMVLPAAAINDVCAWILLALGVALSGSGENHFTPAWVLLCGTGFAIFMLTVTRRFMSWVASRATNEECMGEIYVCVTLIGVLIAGFTTEVIGLHPLFGAFVFGLVIPKEGKFAEVVTEKIEDFVTVLMLPLFFASSGLKTNLGKIDSAQSFGFLVLLFVTAAGGKVSATWVIAVAQGTEKRTALAVAFLMNTKGLVELIILNIGKDLKVLNDQTFAILVLMCLLTTFITTPVVIALYKPARTSIPYTSRNLQDINPEEELRILACIHGARTIPPIINFLEIARVTRKRPSKAYILHFIELSDRPSSLMIANKASNKAWKFRLPKFNGSRSERDPIHVTFEAYGKLNKVKVKTKTVVSEFDNMHEDICRTAAEKRAAFIVVPFHKCHRGDGDLEDMNPSLRKVNRNVLQHAPCSVGIIIDRGPDQLMSSATVSRRIAVLFFGGPDDREALALGCRLAEHPGVTLTVVRFLPGAQKDSIVIDLLPGGENPDLLSKRKLEESPDTYGIPKASGALEKGRLLDEKCLDFARKQQNESVVYEEQTISNASEGVIATARTNKFNLFLVGRGRHAASFSAIIAVADRQPAEFSELGPVGGVLAGGKGDDEMQASVVVVQQHESWVTEVPFSLKVVDDLTPISPKKPAILPAP